MSGTAMVANSRQKVTTASCDTSHATCACNERIIRCHKICCSENVQVVLLLLLLVLLLMVLVLMVLVLSLWWLDILWVKLLLMLMVQTLLGVVVELLLSWCFEIGCGRVIVRVCVGVVRRCWEWWRGVCCWRWRWGWWRGGWRLILGSVVYNLLNGCGRCTPCCHWVLAIC